MIFLPLTSIRWLPGFVTFASLGFVSVAVAQSLTSGESGVATARNNINFSELFSNQAGASTQLKQKVKPPSHRRLTANVPPAEGPPKAVSASAPQPSLSAPVSASAFAGTSLASVAAVSLASTSAPNPSASFPGLLSNGTVHNPDTQGAVGPNHLMVTLNSQIRIQNRDGGEISTVSIDSFWAGLRTSNVVVFDPRIIYDPYGQRFIFTAEANPGGADPGLLIAVSQTSNPTGNWFRYFVDVNTVADVYADSPNVGFNKDWIVVQTDTYDRTNDFFFESEVYVFNKTNLYAGGAGIWTKIPMPHLGDAQVPAMTYDPDLATVYLLSDWSGSYGLRVFSITGPVNAPALVNNAIYVVPDNVWSDFPPYQNFAPQLGTTNKIATDDARIQNVVYRGGSLFACQTIFEPGAGPVTSSVVFWEVAPVDGGILQQVTISDPSGQTMRAYPSVAVNKHYDVLMAYSIFSQGSYAGAAYSFRSGGSPKSGIGEDPFSTMRPEVMLKEGEAPYFRPTSSGRNAWGDWSAAAVDPGNDTDLWTLQEYAATPSGTTNRWGTWWGRISPIVSLTLKMTGSPNPVTAGNNVTFSLTVTNNLELRDTPSGDSGVRIVNPIPPGASFVSASATQGSCTVSNNSVVCLLGFLNDGAQAGATIVLSPSIAGFFTNTATVSANGPDIDPSDNVVSVGTTVNAAANLAISLSDSPDPVTVTSNLSYLIVVTNLGPSAALGVNVTNTLPADVTFVSVQTSIGVCSQNGRIVSCNLGTLTPGASASIIITNSPTTSGNITNSVTVSSTTADPSPANNSASTTTQVNAKPTISSIAAQSVPEDAVLGPISFTIGDAETPSTSLVLSVSSSSANIIPNANVILGGAGANRTITLTPATNQFGNSTISLTVVDADGAVSVSTFVVSVLAINDPPTGSHCGYCCVRGLNHARDSDRD
jgi:uncharacterized repeat protein (TIGR01451 family)